MDHKNGISFENIQNNYNNLSYFDQYGSSVLMVILITIILILMCLYCFVMINVQPIKDNWVAERCSPKVIPFAGLINKPDGMSISDFTKENFNFCTTNILTSITGEILSPLSFTTKKLTELTSSISNSLNEIRTMFDKIRTLMQSISEEIMGRVINTTIPLQQIIITVKDIMSKVQGILVSSLFMFLGSYYSLKALMGTIAQFIITILITLAFLIVIMWLTPFTWGAAVANTGIFIALSIPMSIILVFMTQILNVRPDLSIPTVKCFDKNTLIKMNDGTNKTIFNIQVGNVLDNNNIVTSKIKVVTEGSIIYDLNGIIVSDSHIVKYKSMWIPVSKHPLAKKINYNEPHLYCLNTSSKTITINNMCFTDWDEIFDEDINIFKKIFKEHGIDSNNTIDIHKYFDGGLSGDTIIKLKDGTHKMLQNIDVRDILENGEKVYGLVQINGNDLIGQYTYDLGKSKIIVGGPNINIQKSNLISINSLNIKNQKLKTKKKILYHLLTDRKTFVVNEINICDYNSGIDKILGKN